MRPIARRDKRLFGGFRMHQDGIHIPRLPEAA